MTAKKMILSTCLVFTLLNACASDSTPTPEPIKSNAAAIAIVDQFYTSINNAQNEHDFDSAWALLSNEAQCNPVNRCDLVYFEKRWWSSQVVYTLYDCGHNRVAVQELRYPRDSDFSSASESPKYWLYLLNDLEEDFMISEINLIQALEAECVLVK